MAEHPSDHGSEPIEQEHGEVRYERMDIRLRVVLLMLLGAGVFALVDQVAIWQLFKFRKGAQQTSVESPYPNSPNVSSRLPSEPRLEQINRLAAVKSANAYERLKAQESLLHSYGPTNDKGFVHIPIDEAIKAVADRLPVRKDMPSEADRGLINWGESNSGRMLRGESP
jgi:hypothetical protein